MVDHDSPAELRSISPRTTQLLASHSSILDHVPPAVSADMSVLSNTASAASSSSGFTPPVSTTPPSNRSVSRLVTQQQTSTASSSSSSVDAPASPSNTSQSADDAFEDEDDIDDDLGDEATEDGDEGGEGGLPSKNLMHQRRTTLKGPAASRVGTAIASSNARSKGWEVRVNTYDARPSPTNLPQEIFIHIFRYLMMYPRDLRNCMLVCKTWCLCAVELLWHRPTFPKLASLFKLIPVMRRPDQMFPYATFIRRLNFNLIGAELPDLAFRKMADCVRLERLTLEKCQEITDESLVKVFSNTKQLAAIDLTGVHQATDDAIFTVAKNCPRLQGINLSGCKLLTSESIAALARACSMLRRIKLCGCELIDDEAIFALTQHCPTLLEVDLMKCPRVTDASVRTIWERCFHLREFRLSQCTKLTDLAFPSPWRSHASNAAIGFPEHREDALGRSGPSVAQLHHIGDSLRASSAGSSRRTGAVSAGTGALPSGADGPDSAPITRVTSPFGHSGSGGGATHRGPHQGGDVAISHAVMARTTYEANSGATSQLGPSIYRPAPPRRFEHLRILDLTNCAALSDASIEGIIDNVPKIRNLVLAKCTRLTDESIYSIARLGKHLQFLHLGHVSNITDQAVIHLSRSCTKIRYIDFACCVQLTDASVFELASNLPRLRRIGLVRVSNLTDDAILALVERYTTLERIHLSYCENISVPVIYWLLLKLSRLTHLSLTGVPAFRRKELQKMCRDPPQDFNEHQRAAFCVFSGKGVNDLRDYLEKAYRDPTKEAELGALSPELRRAVILLHESREAHRLHAERHRYHHYHRHHQSHHAHHHDFQHLLGKHAILGGGATSSNHALYRSLAPPGTSVGTQQDPAYAYMYPNVNVGRGQTQPTTSQAFAVARSNAAASHAANPRAGGSHASSATRVPPTHMLDPIWRSGTSDGFLSHLRNGRMAGSHASSHEPTSSTPPPIVISDRAATTRYRAGQTGTADFLQMPPRSPGARFDPHEGADGGAEMDAFFGRSEERRGSQVGAAAESFARSHAGEAPMEGVMPAHGGSLSTYEAQRQGDAIERLGIDASQAAGTSSSPWRQRMPGAFVFGSSTTNSAESQPSWPTSTAWQQQQQQHWSSPSERSAAQRSVQGANAARDAGLAALQTPPIRTTMGNPLASLQRAESSERNSRPSQ